MKELIYAGGKTIVSDELAAALMDYAQIMAATGDSGVVDIPAIGEDGTVGTTRLLLGPASQIIAEPVTVDPLDLDDSAVIEELRSRTRAAGAAHPMSEDSGDITATEEFPL